MKNRGIPVISIEGKSLPEVWERSVIKTWEEGIDIKTEYDKPGDPPSKDCTMVLTITEPLSEPRIHRAFPAGLEDLEVYKQEVIEGIHDSWISPEEGKWTYTYHKRLFDYEIESDEIDQIAYIIDKLSKAHCSRRAQAITWNPKLDPPSYDPPCLQRIWCRITEDKEKNLFLNMNTHWRSRDAYLAAFMNIFALTELQRSIAQRITERAGKEVHPGRYTDITDSYHIYGSYYEEFERFLKTVKERSFAERTWDTKFAEPFFQEARERIKEADSKNGNG